MHYIETCDLPTEWGEFKLHAFENVANSKEHLALTYGAWNQDESVLLRVHSECLTGDALFSQRGDSGSKLARAFDKVSREGSGAILYLRQEGRGIGLINKIRAYHLQEQGYDTVEANNQLGFGADLRDYQMCKAILEHLGIKRVRLLTNNPRKVEALLDIGVEIEERIPYVAKEGSVNEHYLEARV